MKLRPWSQSPVAPGADPSRSTLCQPRARLFQDPVPTRQCVRTCPGTPPLFHGPARSQPWSSSVLSRLDEPSPQGGLSNTSLFAKPVAASPRFKEDGPVDFSSPEPDTIAQVGRREVHVREPGYSCVGLYACVAGLRRQLLIVRRLRDSLTTWSAPLQKHAGWFCPHLRAWSARSVASSPAPASPDLCVSRLTPCFGTAVQIASRNRGARQRRAHADTAAMHWNARRQAVEGAVEKTTRRIGALARQTLMA